jgi:hypothetical protein
MALRLGFLAMTVSVLSGCGTTIDAGQPAATPAVVPGGPATGLGLTERPTNLRREQLVGRWGVASYREEKDRKRVEAQARAQCRLPYVIALGPSDGVMMHLADDAKLYELRLKGASDGKTYLGPEAPPGDWQDREIVSLQEREMVMRFVDPEVHGRYGTFIYVRCS